MITEVSPTTTVILDGSGNGQCALGPPSGTKWALRLATVATSTASKQPQAKLYRGSPSGPIQLVDSTFTGASASSGKVGGPLYYPGQLLWAVWTGGDPGATATLQAFGQQGNRNDPFDAAPFGEGFANPVVSQLIVGTPGGPEIVIGVAPLPADLLAYYASAPIGTNPETIVGATINYDGAGNYAYQALVIDSSAPKMTSLVTGASVAGVVNEASRFALNPGVVLGNARFQTFLEENILVATSATGSTTVFAAQAIADAFHRLSINRDGVIGFGSGAALTDAFIDRVDVGELRAANRLDVINFGALTDTTFAVGLSSEANQRMFVRANGQIRFSDGTAASDTTIERASAGVITVGGNSILPNTAVANVLPAGTQTTTSTTYVDVTGVSVSFTKIYANTRVKVQIIGHAFVSAVDNITLGVNVNSADTDVDVYRFNAINDYRTFGGVVAIAAFAAGTYTVKARIKVATGTTTLTTGASVARWSIEVTEIAP